MQVPIGLRLAKDTSPATPTGRTARAREKAPFLEDQTQPKLAEQKCTPVGQGRKLLVVDDNPVVLKAFELKLKNEGFNVRTLSNAAGVTGAIAEDGADLIILDVNFPSSGMMEWSGFTVMQWLRHWPELARIPVLLISGGEAAEYEQKALDAGAFAFLRKPVDFRTLITTIQQALG